MKIKWELLPAAIAAVVASPAWGQGQIGPLNTVQCSANIIIPVGASGVTKVATGAVGKVIYICGWHQSNTGTSGNFQLSYGTGANCTTSNATLTPLMNVSSTAPSVDHIQYAQMQVPTNSTAGANPDLCITVTTGVGGLVYMGQY